MKIRLAVLAAAVAVAGAGIANAADPCLTPLIEDEPMCNPAVGEAAWPISHSSFYAQGSSPLAGPVPGNTVTAEHVDLTGLPITLATSPEYGDGHYAIWGSLLGLNGGIVKIDSDTFALIDTYIPADEEVNPPAIPLGVSGAYSVATPDNNFLLGRADFVEIYGDSVPGDRSSEIALIKRAFLPSTAFCRTDDLLVGGVLLSDNYLALISEQAVLSVIPADEASLEAANVISLPSENGADCANLGIPSEDLETVSNSIAADENGGIYVVTEAAVIKYQWDGTTLSKVWRTEYESDNPFSVLRLGPGSGSTPSLMGTAPEDDRFVVITDGQELMHLVFLWRDDIPAGWQPIAPGKDPRIACEVPVTFGDDDVFRTLSEQSVLVRGYGAVTVNNLLTTEFNIGVDTPIAAVNTAIAALRGGDPNLAPHGAERWDWDPIAETCVKQWTNTEVSLPNAIPTMSAATGLMHALGQRGGVWGMETLDFDTGESVMFSPSSQTTCSQNVLDAVSGSLLGGFLDPVLLQLPASCENSMFAATEVGPDGVLYQGTFQGASRFVPDSVATVSKKRNSQAGTKQAVDVANRGVDALPGDVEKARDAAKRGQVQLAASLTAVADGTGSDIDAASAAGATAAINAAIAHFAAAEAAVDTDVVLAESELSAALADSADANDWVTPCPPAAQSDCRVPAKAAFSIKIDGEKSKMKWKWKSSVSEPSVPDPMDRGAYGVCVYDTAGANRLASAVIPSSHTRWKAITDGYKYKDKLSAYDGVKTALIKEKINGGTAKVVAKGLGVPSPSLPATAPMVVQLVNSETGLCWDAVFAVDDIKKNEAAELKMVVKND